MATREELIAQVKRKRLIAQVQAQRTGSDTPEKSVKLSPQDEVSGLVRSLSQGASFGYADEVGSAAGATVEAAKNYLSGNDEGGSWGENYDSRMDYEASKRKEYSAAHPYGAMITEAGGGFATAGLSGAKILATQAVQQAPKLYKALAAAMVGSTEGAIYGYGTGNTSEERLENSEFGRNLGFLLPAALSATGATIRGAVNKFKMANKIPVVDGKQMPLNLADKDGWRGKGYRDTVGTAFGGTGVRAKSEPFIQAANDTVELKVKRGRQVAEALRNVNKAQTTADTLANKQSVDAAKVNITNATQKIKETATKEISDVDTVFRNETRALSLPNKMSDKARKIVDDPLSSSTQKNDAITTSWNKNGFDDFKQLFFDVEEKVFKTRMNGLFNTNPTLKRSAGDYMPEFNRNYKELVNAKTGQMSGKNFMELRNRYATAANDATDPTERKMFRTISNKIDEVMTEGLPASSKTKFNAEKEAYDNFSVMRKATEKAATKKIGDYTPDDWLGSTKGYRRGRGTGAGQDIAVKAQTSRNAIQEAQGSAIKNAPEKTALVDLRASNIVSSDAAKETRRIRGINSTKKAKDVLAKAEATKKDVEFSTPAKKPSLATRLISSGLLGGGFMAGPASIPIGMGVAKTLQNDTVQRVVAGQSQDEILNTLSRAKIGKTHLSDILRQGTTGAATSLIGSGE